MPYATPYSYGYPAAPAPVMAPVATVVKTQYHMQDEFGQASYGFSEPHHTQSVVQVCTLLFKNYFGKYFRVWKII